jgi:hypothetical protein
MKNVISGFLAVTFTANTVFAQAQFRPTPVFTAAPAKKNGEVEKSNNPPESSGSPLDVVRAVPKTVVDTVLSPDQKFAEMMRQHHRNLIETDRYIPAFLDGDKKIPFVRANILSVTKKRLPETGERIIYLRNPEDNTRTIVACVRSEAEGNKVVCEKLGLNPDKKYSLDELKRKENKFYSRGFWVMGAEIAAVVLIVSAWAITRFSGERWGIFKLLPEVPASVGTKLTAWSSKLTATLTFVSGSVLTLGVGQYTVGSNFGGWLNNANPNTHFTKSGMVEEKMVNDSTVKKIEASFKMSDYANGIEAILEEIDRERAP